MGAVIPIVGAVTGIASATSGISAQRSQANQQREALLQQEQAQSRNTQLRLNEIEQQRLYAQYQSQIEASARANNLAYQQQEDAITQQQIQFANQQNQFMARLSQMQNQGQIDDQRVAGQINQQSQQVGQSFDEANTSLGLANSGLGLASNRIGLEAARGNLQFSNTGRQIQSEGQDLQSSLSRQQLLSGQNLQQAGETAQFQNALGQEQLGFQQNLQGLVRQNQQAQVGANAQQLSAEQEALQGSQGLNRLAQEGTREVEQAGVQRGNILLGQSQGDVAGISQSGRLLAQTPMNEATKNALERRMVINEGQSSIAANLELQRGLADFTRTDANTNLIQGARNLESTRQLSRGQLEDSRLLSQFGRENQLQGFDNSANAQRFLTSIGSDLQSRQEQFQFRNQERQFGIQNDQFDIQQRQARLQTQQGRFGASQQDRLLQLQNQALDRGQLISNSETEYALLQSALDSGMEQQALQLLQQARLNTNDLENQASTLNNTMSDIAFSQNAFSTINTGRAELNALQSQRRSVQSPGFLSMAGGVINGASQIYGALNQPRQTQPQTQGYSFNNNFRFTNTNNPQQFR